MKPYNAEKLPLKNLDHKRLFKLAVEANESLALYNGLLHGIVNPTVLLSPLTTQEAVLSSKIEGTQATVDEVLEYEAGMEMDGHKEDDINEVLNYRKAIFAAKDVLSERPISLTIIRQMHKILMSGVRGKNKAPGEFRNEQNWIGLEGCTIDQAKFIPPSPLKMQDYLLEWEKYVNEDDIDAIVQAALAHAQFELIHPFKDGNGRIGRLLIPLFLFKKKKLISPMFYLSEYLEANRDEYYNGLNNISQKSDWNGWIEFFLKAVATQAKKNNAKVKQILSLYDMMKETINYITRSQYSMHVLDAIFDRPIFKSSEFVKRTGIPKQTAMPLLRQLKKAAILVELRRASGRRPAVLAFHELLNIAESKSIF